uniref:Uncharacterized protein n=1 Tax=Hyaloperonospora arabidopsidis (strain Emoy2) TaxID=559515 RepID=M4B3V5_HYAAE
MRKLFRKDDESDRGLQLRLRKAVAGGKARKVAVLLEKGACPIWMDDETHGRQRFHHRHSDACQLNALLLACRHGDVEVLSLLLDAFFDEPQVLAHFSRAMYCLVIRHGHWNAFQRLQQRRVPITSASSRSSTGSTESLTSDASSRLLSAAAMEHSSSKLPVPIFVAAEHGRHHILSFLLNHYPHDWAHYTFEGYSLLTVATINGHYDCVSVLLERQVATRRTIDAAVAAARRHRQAHVLVLLTSKLPEFASDSEPFYKRLEDLRRSNNVSDLSCHPLKSSCCSALLRGRGSIAETVASDLDDEGRRSSLFSISSPINYNEGSDHVEDMRNRAEMEREQQRIRMMWLLDGREAAQDKLQGFVNPYRLSADSFRVLKSARDAAPSSNNSCSSYQEDDSWYAVKSDDRGQQQQHDDLLASDEEEEVESYYESMFSVHEDEVNYMSDEQLPPLYEETHKPVTTFQPLIVRSGKSRKIISVRSHRLQNQLLTAIEENSAGETEP